MGTIPKVWGQAVHQGLQPGKMSTLFRLALTLIFLFCSSCTNTSRTATVDRYDPEALLRAYFDAWGRGDWSAEASFMDAKFAGMAPEPVDAIRILEIYALKTSSTWRAYQVTFEIKVKSDGVSMQSGKYNWNYYLTWNAKHASWLISDYGCC
jgi:hypothetical protein